ncbi:MAG: protein-export chaperone SecB [Lewinellaceae bacterium]|nr:protein-export chaperone SecB [Lewinellaceae bacterium]
MKDVNSSTVEKASLSFHDFHVKSCFWEYTGEDLTGDLNIEINPYGRVELESNKFILALSCKLDIENLFRAQLEVVGFFSFSSFNEEGRSFCLNNAPAILFPHIRSYIAALTALSGMNSILIPALNISGLSKQLQGNLEIIDAAT